jgi:DNA-binding CsgD family transcriptional regulator
MALKRLPDIKVQIAEVSTDDTLNDYMHMQQPDVIVINPGFNQFFDIDAFRSRYPDSAVRIVAINCGGYTDPTLLSKYDAQISIFDSLESLTATLSALQAKDDDEQPDEEQESLSQREKEIVVCVVKGLTNKEIAEQLYLSVHTVITHRKNISRKLQIHSVSGLTIYAIVNKLVELSDIEKQ